MEWNVKLRRTQSLKSVSDSGDKPVWRSTGLSDKAVSVSDLVARYQTAVSGSPIIQASPTFHRKAKKAEEVPKEKAPSTQKAPQKSILKKTEEKSQAKANLTPAKSLDSLQSSAASIMSLRALYEVKAPGPDKERSGIRAASASRHTKDVPVMNGGARDTTIDVKTKKSVKAVQNVAKTQTKQERVDKEAAKVDRVERRKTIAGIDFERSAAADADEKRRSIADLRDIQTKEKLSISVKVMSALYLSKVATKESTNTPLKPEQNRSPELGKRGRSFQFQATSQEMCSACLKPVYQMEKITAADKYTYHKNCFRCKKCKKKLSVSNYTPANGEFYCIFHYQQLFKRKGNYDEGFGHAQHKNRWLLRSTSSQKDE